MRRALMIALLLGVMPVMAGRAEEPPLLGQMAGLRLTAVTDADSLRVGPLRLRLFGVDAPEMRQQCRDQAGNIFACGKAARDFLASWLPSGAEISCDLLDQDRYGRLVTRCYYDGQDIAARLVEAGWALAYQSYSKDYLPAEERAKSTGNGLWAGSFDRPWDWRRTQRR